ncbi:MAG: hypothetical protein KC425_19145, partial [Anaerolineales bacterium]|nr:hypothetical protein [Anaerolineales bacterium]
HIQDCFARYNKLRHEVRKVDFSADFLEFGDTLDSLLHAGLLAYAQGDWQTAVAFFTFFEQNERGYVAIRPLRDRVAAALADVQAGPGAADWETAVAQAGQRTLDQLLTAFLAP